MHLTKRDLEKLLLLAQQEHRGVIEENDEESNLAHIWEDRIARLNKDIEQAEDS